MLFFIIFACTCIIAYLYWTGSEKFSNQSQAATNPFKSVWTDDKKKAAVGLLKHLHSKTNRYFLAYGTLLGYERHKGHIIPWDDDIDVGMREDDFELIRDQLNNDGIELVQFHEYAYKIHYKKNKKIKQYAWSWPFIDIFIFVEDPVTSELYCPWENKRRFANNLFFPLRYATFENTKAIVPNNPRAILDIQYGRDWESKCDSGFYSHENEDGRGLERQIVDCADVM